MRSLGVLTDWRKEEAAARAAWVLLAIALLVIIARAVCAVSAASHGALSAVRRATGH